MLIALAAGCAEPPARARPPETPPIAQLFDGAADISDSEWATYEAAEDVLIARCMRRAGFSYLSRDARPTVRDVPQNPYGLLTVEQARVHGYGMTEAALARPPAHDPNGSTRQGLSKQRRRAWDAALMGSDRHRKEIRIKGGGIFTYRSDSCTYAARLQVMGPGWDRLYLSTMAASNTGIGRVLADTRVRQAEQRWAACMAKNGYRVRTLSEARRPTADALQAAVSMRGDNSQALTAAARKEQREAVADAGCQTSSHLRAAIATAQHDVERMTSQQVRAEFEQLRSARMAALQRARDLLP